MNTVKKIGQKLEAIVLYEIAGHPELKIARGLEGPGINFGLRVISGEERYQIRVKRRRLFGGYGLWIESHNINDPTATFKGGDISVYDSRYLECGKKIARKCEELSGVKYSVLVKTKEE